MCVYYSKLQGTKIRIPKDSWENGKREIETGKQDDDQVSKSGGINFEIMEFWKQKGFQEKMAW